MHKSLPVMKSAFSLVFAFIMVLTACSSLSETAPWNCPECGREGNTGNFCGFCGHPAPWLETPTDSGSPSADPVIWNITVWVSENAVDLTKKQIQAYNKSNQDGLIFNAAIKPVSESEAADKMLTNIAAGADLYCFAQDQFARLLKAGALLQLDDSSAQAVRRNNDTGSVAAAVYGDALYAWPLTSDNGYFMYYDKRVIPESDIDSLEKLISDCEKAGKTFDFELQTSAWYMASFFFATGCRSEWITDNAGTFIAVNDTFNSPEGRISVKGMKKLLDSPVHRNSSSVTEFKNGAAVVVSGTWDYLSAQKILGTHLGTADLPSFEWNGVEYHLGSFNGCKLMGVKPQAVAEKGAALHKLAQYLTRESAQMERFTALAWAPSNLIAQKSDAVQANPGIAALLAQAPFSVPQGDIHASWWDIAKTIADDVKKAAKESDLQKALDHYSSQIQNVLK